MGTNLFIRSLSWNVTDDMLRETFSAAGEVTSANVIMDKERNRSKGYGFVEMSTPEEAAAAIEQFNETDLDGREIYVDYARPREER